MSDQRELKVLPFTKGSQLRIVTRENEANDSVDKYFAEVTYDGLPSSEVFYVPAHWHKHHDEYMLVTEGRVQVTIEGSTRIIVAGDEPAFIPRWHTHSMRGFEGERLVLQEKAVPAGRIKGLFFNDLLSQGPNPSIPHSLRVFYDGDTYLSLGSTKLIDQTFLFVLGGIAKSILFWDRKPMEF